MLLFESAQVRFIVVLCKIHDACKIQKRNDYSKIYCWKDPYVCILPNLLLLFLLMYSMLISLSNKMFRSFESFIPRKFFAADLVYVFVRVDFFFFFLGLNYSYFWLNVGGLVCIEMVGKSKEQQSFVGCASQSQVLFCLSFLFFWAVMCQLLSTFFIILCMFLNSFEVTLLCMNPIEDLYGGQTLAFLFPHKFLE